MADQGGFSDNEVLNATKPHGGHGLEQGASDLGAVLSGSLQQNAQAANIKGMQVGAQTADALAQARSRVQEAQGRESAAQALQNPQTQAALGIKPEEADWAAAQTRAGGQAESIAAALQNMHKARLEDTVANTGAAPDARRGAAMALAPASGAIHAEGPNGTFVDPFSSGYTSNQPGSPTNTPVTVGAQQTSLNDSEVKLRAAQASAAGINANAHQETADHTAAGAPKLNTGYQWKVDNDKTSPTYGQVMQGPNGPIQEPNPNAGKGSEGVINARYNQNMLGGAAGAARELENVAAIGPTTSAGATGFATGHGGILGTLSDNLGRAVSSQDQQEYHKSMQNIGRYVGLVENGGRATTAGAAGSAQAAIEAQPGDTEHSRLYGLAIARQSLEAQQDRINASTASTAVKDAYNSEIQRVTKAIPYTPVDIIDFGRAPAGTKLQDFLASRNGGGGGKTAPKPSAPGDPASAPPPPGFKVLN